LPQTVKPSHACLLWSVLAFGPMLCAAEVRTEPNASAVPDSGFWPTPRMVEVLLLKGVDAISERYQFDESQYGAIRKDFLVRYPELLKRHRAALQPIVNEILEMGLAEEKPTPETVAEWAQKLDPVVADTRKALRATHDEIAPLLRPDQKRRWDVDFAQLMIGLGVVDAQLALWKRGQFDPNEWPPKLAGAPRGPSASSPTTAETPPTSPIEVIVSGFGAASGRRLDTVGDRRNEPSNTKGPTGPSEIPLDRWEGYVKEFIRTHDLDKAQANQAMAILRDVRQRAKQYQDKNKDEFKRIDRESAVSGPDRRAVLREQLKYLQAPLNDLFDELRSRLDGVLGSNQRSR